MDKNIDISYPVGAFEDIREFDLKEFGDLENPTYVFPPGVEEKFANLVGYRLENAERLVGNNEYDVAMELTRSVLWMLEILNRQSTVKNNKK